MLLIVRSKSGLLKLVLGIASLAGCLAASEIEVAKQKIPVGATIETYPQRRPDGQIVSVPAVASGQLAGASGTGVAFVFVRNGLLGLRVVISGQRELDAPLPGTFVQTIEGFGSPIVVTQLVPSPQADILVASSEGASAGSYLSVYRVGNGGLVDLVGVPVGGSSFAVDCQAGQPCRILAWGKWTDHSSAWVRVYGWNGRAYVPDESDAEEYARRKLVSLAEVASGTTKLPVFTRVSIARVAIDEYVYRKDYENAANLCEVALGRLNDRELSAPREFVNVPKRNDAQLTIDIETGKAQLHDLLGNAYQLMGRASDAMAQFEESVKIRQSAVPKN